MKTRLKCRKAVLLALTLLLAAAVETHAQLQPVDRVAAFDGGGNRVGRLQGLVDPNGPGQVALTMNGQVAVLSVRRDRLEGNLGNGNVFFASNDCTLGSGESPFFVPPKVSQLAPGTVLAGNFIYVELPDAFPQNVFWNSVLGADGVCVPQGSTQVGLFVPVFLLGNHTFSPPYSLGEDTVTDTAALQQRVGQAFFHRDHKIALLEASFGRNNRAHKTPETPFNLGNSPPLGATF